MNRDFVERALAQAERHVAEGEAILTRQRAAIVASERIGGNVARFKELLSVFEDSQRVHVADRDRLRKDLENAPGPTGEKRAADEWAQAFDFVHSGAVINVDQHGQ